MPTILRWFLYVVGGFFGLLLLIFIGAGLIPPETDPPVDMTNHGAGSSSVQPSYTGLQRAFPDLNEPDDNPTTSEKVELGRLLFFDPILSENNDMSCATCHHPDRGFSDGLATALGPDGQVLERNTLTLWNVGYAGHLFWDGRLSSLEEQTHFPLTHPDEMGVTDTDALMADLRAIPEYIDLFNVAFGGGETAVTLDNLTYALAAFQRTLISNNSPFDRYAAGDFNALTQQQRRGLALFRSGATRCFECHTAPTFASDTFRVVGVPSDDPGRAAVAADGTFGAFKVPTLRNIALNAPYMHDGSMATLTEVIDFYAEGGGRAHAIDKVDMFVNGFELSNQDREDLIAFLYALTDESQLPIVPTAVPSGLPVVERFDNPERDRAAIINIGSNNALVASRPPTTLLVEPGMTIQETADLAQSGDTIEIPYGIYHERVVIDLNDITLRGIPNADGEYPILDGQGVLSEGVLASGNNFTVSHLHLRNYTSNGILVEGVTGVHFHDIFAENTGIYGLYPVQSTDVIVERTEVTGAKDAGIYAGQCENVIVRDSVVYGNVLGIELENTLNGEVYNNHAYDNTVGIFVVLLPQLTAKISSHTLIYDNIIENNNHVNFAPENMIASVAPSGVGVLLLATDHAEVYNNEIVGNKSTGVAVFSLTRSGAFDVNEIDIGPLPEHNWVHSNRYENNGYDPDPFVKDLGIPVGDLLWDGSGVGNRFNEEGISSFPPLLPGNGWPGFVQRAYGNILNFLIGLIG